MSKNNQKNQSQKSVKNHKGIDELKEEIAVEAKRIANNEVSSCYMLVMKAKELINIEKTLDLN